MPGVVCTVVPASGSRSSLLTPRLKSELGPAAGYRSRVRPDGRWGARELTTGSPEDGELRAPHLLWPGDHRWFVATDVDSGFTWAGGSDELIDAVIGDPKLKAERVHRR